MLLPSWTAHVDALADARRWCALHFDASRPAESLRTSALRPAGYPDEWDYGDLFCDRVEALIVRRRELLGSASPPHDGTGAILCVLGGLDTAMGEGTPASRGVIDDSYLPPWDTWFACIDFHGERVLLAWIPAALEQDVQGAIEVAATEPIAWLDGPLPEGAEWQRIVSLLADARIALR